MPPLNLVKASIFAALAIGAGFALLLVPNIELITAIVFCAGMVLGPGWGMLIGAVAEGIFSSLHPLGSGLAFPPLLLTQILSMSLVGLCGGLLQPVFARRDYSLVRTLALGGTGFLLTFIFDSLTTLSFPLSAGFDWPQIATIYLAGIGFTFVHQTANAVIFAVGIPQVLRKIL